MIGNKTAPPAPLPIRIMQEIFRAHRKPDGRFPEDTRYERIALFFYSYGNRRRCLSGLKCFMFGHMFNMDHRINDARLNEDQRLGICIDCGKVKILAYGEELGI